MLEATLASGAVVKNLKIQVAFRHNRHLMVAPRHAHVKEKLDAALAKL